MPVFPPPADDTTSPSALDSWLRAAVDAADALAKLHQSGIIHQSIRPQTFRIDLQGKGVEIKDAYLRQQPAPPALHLSVEALPYLAPEQTGRLEGPIDHRADLYSLGVVLYELRAGVLPFSAEDALGWVHCHVARPPRPLEEAAPGTPPIVSALIMKLLAKPPDERYQSARGLLHDLERCQSELSAHGRVDPFPLGARDVWDKLRAAGQMYGRSEEIAALRAALERVRETGAREVVLITGPSGIGKSSLVRELQRSSTGARAAFLSGKFEKTKRDVPYATLGQAFEPLIRQIVASTDAELSVLRDQLRGALGENGQLIVDLVPQLELVIGKQPPVVPLPAEGARNRFHATFRSFLRAFASRERPLILFLDDLQWADFASLELVQQLLTYPDVRSVLFLGAYRDDEVDPSHPLEVTLREIRGAGCAVEVIRLGPLPEAALAELAIEVFGCGPDKARSLASLLGTKAGGNPFFTVQLLSVLHEEHLIHFDTAKWAWSWDIAELEDRGLSDDMVELVLGKLGRLPDETLDVLKLAACIGNEFSAHLAGRLCGKTPEEVRGALEPALLDGLLLQRREGYKFLHDRVLQSAYSLVPEGERAGLHLRLGWLLLELTPETEIDGRLFAIVNQLNLGAERVEAAGDRRRIADYSLRAGRKAKVASAARSAVKYLTTGLSFLPEDRWSTEYALAHSLHLELAECEYLSGRFDEAERLAAIVLSHAKSRVDQVAASCLQIQIATAQVDNARALKAGLASLRLFGVELSKDLRDEDLQAEVGWIRDHLRDRAIEDLIDLPVMSDPNRVAALELLAAVYPAAVYTLPDLARVMICRMVRLSILYGNSPASAQGYAIFANILGYRFGEYRDSYRFGKLACDLVDRPGFGSCRVEALSAFGGMTLTWSRPLREALAALRACVKMASDSGKLLYVAVALINSAGIMLAMGEPLEAVDVASASAVEFARNAKFAFLVDSASIIQRFMRSLRGDSERLGSLSGDGLDEAAFEAHLRERNIPLVELLCCIYKLMARFFAGDYAGAYAAAKEADELHWSTLHTIEEVEHRFYAALTLAALCEGAGDAERARLLGELSAHEDQLRRWTESCPESFAGRHALVLAEVARVDGRDHEAMILYDKAIRVSRDGGSPQIEGLACELAGRFYLRRAFAVQPAAYLREARACYARWGARGKVRALEALYPELFYEPRGQSAPTADAGAEADDTLTAAKASTAISSELSPEELLATLMRILIEHTGAQRGGLLLPSEDGLNVAAEITSDPDGVRVETPKGRCSPSPAAFPLSIAHYVRRTREKLILDDFAAEMTFGADPYLASARPRSMLCAPIVRRGEVTGILYLENRLVRGAFTPRRLALLRFLAAVSLENALLTADLARETTERTQAERTLQKSEERLQRLVETAKVVPWEADRATGRFTYVGPQVVNMLGYPHAAWLSPGFLAEHVHPDDRKRTRAHLFTSPSDADRDFRMTAADGRTMWLHNVVSEQPPSGAGALGGFLFDVTDRKEAEAMLQEKLDIIEEQQVAIRKLSTPIMDVWEGVLTMPVLGVVNEERAEQMMTVLLEAVTRTRARHAILDLTGADSVDTRMAAHIMKIARAVQLLGARSIVVGIRPEVARTIVAMGVDMSSILTLANLRQALLLCMRDGRGEQPVTPSSS